MMYQLYHLHVSIINFVSVFFISCHTNFFDLALYYISGQACFIPIIIPTRIIGQILLFCFSLSNCVCFIEKLNSTFTFQSKISVSLTTYVYAYIYKKIIYTTNFIMPCLFFKNLSLSLSLSTTLIIPYSSLKCFLSFHCLNHTNNTYKHTRAHTHIYMLAQFYIYTYILQIHKHVRTYICLAPCMPFAGLTGATTGGPS